ncbi:Abi family protein [Ligilactobacillus sp. WILCCON 0076]|uniref:Abi family protein n=1 Tax=Ligilactobacillus ubinensis TaxID=2876789 RepID=A0A9X2FKH3_9LACO|nr:Abi family protein [Ligilactobacillus ubinensis]MCP0886975.1 Abi family protein [Ligilactobacillus ubinensis]
MYTRHSEITFKNYKHMINKLRDKGMIIDNEYLAIELLKSRGYYNLINRYKEEFTIPNTKNFQPNTHITDLYYYHRIEDDLRNILFKFTINFEQRFKETMSYILAKQLGVSPKKYLDPINFRNKRKAKSITSFILMQVEKCNDNPTKYYKDEYDYVPPWIMLSNLSLGQTRMLFSIFPYSMTKYVVSELLPIHNYRNKKYDYQSSLRLVAYENMGNIRNDSDIDKFVLQLIETTRNMITIIKDFRNAFAHGNRIVNFHSSQSLKYNSLNIFIKENTVTRKEFFNNGLGRNDLFAFLISLILLMDKYDSIYMIDQLSIWEKNNTKSQHSKTSFYKFIKSCRLPTNFIQRLEKIEIEKTIAKEKEDFRQFF